MSVTVIDAPPDQHGRERFHWRATLGGGTRAGWEYDKAKAHERGEKAERRLLAVESHDPDVLEAADEHGLVYLRKPSGEVAGFTADVASDLVAAGYERVSNPMLDDVPAPEIARRVQRSDADAVEGQPKRRGRPPKNTAPQSADDNEMD